MRKALVVLALGVALVPFGVPRWLIHDRAPVAAVGGAHFDQACRAHGGTPTAGSTGPACAVRYGPRQYRMDSITRTGAYDADSVGFTRRGCAEARREHPDQAFVFHADTGVCEQPQPTS